MTKPPFDIEHIRPGSRLELYISPSCPYCNQAIAHYDQVGSAYTLHDAQNDLAKRAQMFAFTNNDPTVPAIVVDGTYIQSGWGDPLRG